LVLIACYPLRVEVIIGGDTEIGSLSWSLHWGMV
jgi:hypothetical protein